MLRAFIKAAISLIFPGVGPIVADLVAAAFQLVFDLVKGLMGDDSKSGQEKFLHAMTTARASLDEDFDTLPGWSELPEEKRDLIIGGLVELCVFLVKLGAKPEAEREARILARVMRKEARRQAKGKPAKDEPKPAPKKRAPRRRKAAVKKEA